MSNDSDTLEMNTPADAEIVDISASGIRLRLARPIPQGTSVEVNCGEAILHGEIRRCIPEHSTFKNGPYVAGVFIRRAMAAREELKQFTQRLNEQRL